MQMRRFLKRRCLHHFSKSILELIGTKKIDIWNYGMWCILDAMPTTKNSKMYGTVRAAVYRHVEGGRLCDFVEAFFLRRSKDETWINMKHMVDLCWFNEPTCFWHVLCGTKRWVWTSDNIRSILKGEGKQRWVITFQLSEVIMVGEDNVPGPPCFAGSQAHLVLTFRCASAQIFMLYTDTKRDLNIWTHRMHVCYIIFTYNWLIFWL